jgi:ABC-type lipoprotein export system ATPase subunit/CRP-like cAMP-binding protein
MSHPDRPNGTLLDSEPALVEVHQLKKAYKTPVGDFLALKGIDVQIGRGEFVAVIGKSGSGKSTFINMLTGIDRPTAGEVNINGTAVHAISESEMAAWRGLNVGIVFQFFQLLPTLTVLENIMLPMELNKLYSKKERRTRAMGLLDQVELGPQADKLPSEISGGQQQRAAIARALANDPPLIIADEPTGNLDSKTAEKVFQLFEQLVAGGKTILMVTHDNDQARRVQRTLLIADGEIVDEHFVSALSVLSQDQLVELKRRVEPRRCDPGETVIRQGDTGHEFYVVVDGQLNILVDQPGGGQLLVNRLGPGEYFGEMALLGKGFRRATVRVDPTLPATIIPIDQTSFAKLIDDSPELLQNLSETIEKRQATLNLQSFGGLQSELIAELSRDQPVQRFEPGAAIIHQGKIGKTFFVIKSGAVIVEVEQVNGVTHELATLKSGEFFGERALLGKRRRNATVRVSPDGPAEVIELGGVAMRKLLDASPAFRSSLKESADSRAKTVIAKRSDFKDV